MQQHETSYDIVVSSPVGKLGICIQEQQVARLDYLPEPRRHKPASTGFGQRVCCELDSYFKDPGYRFTLPVAATGTRFQQRVWQQLTCIAPGEVCTYGELAASLQSGARAVGNACRHNPVSIIVPCHRVISASGLGGYSGKTGGPDLERKCWLLQHEGAVIPALKSA